MKRVTEVRPVVSPDIVVWLSAMTLILLLAGATTGLMRSRPYIYGVGELCVVCALLNASLISWKKHYQPRLMLSTVAWFLTASGLLGHMAF